MSFIPLSEAAIRKHLRTKFLGRKIIVAQEVVSTQFEFAARGLLSEPEGVVVLAESQTGGRGRMERRFFAPAGSGIYISVLLKPELPPEKVVFVTVCVAVAVCRALPNLKTGIKWVNDVFCNGKKMCGILTEASILAEQQRVEHVITGVGLNTGVVPEEVAGIATSVGAEMGVTPDRNPLVAAFLNEFEPLYACIGDDAARRTVLAEYSARQILMNRRVRVEAFNGAYEAVAVGIDEDGALLVRDDDGKVARLCAGEVSLKMV